MKIKKQVFSWIISVFVAGFFFTIAFKNVEFDAILPYFSKIDYLYLVIFFMLYFFTNIIRTFRWKVIISSVKENSSFLNLFTSMMVGYGVNSIVPRLGEFYRAFFLAKWENISRGAMFGTVIVERIIDLIALFLSVMLSIYLYDGNIYIDIPWLKTTLIWTGTLTLTLTLFIIVLVIAGERSYSFIIIVIRRYSPTFAQQIESLFEKLVSGFSSINGKQNFIYVIISTIMVMFFYGLTSYAGFMIFPSELANGGTMKIAWILMTISAFGVVIPTPGGLGSYHAIVIFVLSTLFNFSEEISVAYAILTHAISYFGFIIIAIISYIFVNIQRKKKNLPIYNFLSVWKNGDE